MKNLHLMFDMDSSPDFLVEAPEVITESESGEKKYKIKGVFSTIGEKNRNGRIYPKAIWESQVKEYQSVLESGSINTLVEYQHPARSEVDPMEAVAKITSLTIEGKYVMGEAVLPDNPKANQIKSLIDNGIKVSVSSRGVGSVKNGIVENYKLITYDIVPVPSDYNATMNGLVESHQLNEGVLSDIPYTLNESGEIVKMQLKDYDKDELNEAVLNKFLECLESFK